MVYYVMDEPGGNLERAQTLPTSRETCLWVDMFRSTDEEKRSVEQQFNVELFTRQEAEEIESSSRYLESEEEIGINLNFLDRSNNTYTSEPVSFILKGNLLVTQRGGDYKAFRDTYKKLSALRPKKGHEVLESLLETRIDYDADLIEGITEQISQISNILVRDNNIDRTLLLQIATLQESTIAIRENILEKQRILSAILKSKFYPKDNYDTLRIMIKDVGSLLDHSSFNFERLEFLQNTFLGLVDMEQNRIIKLFTVVTVVFMPPTLIASMYGMNFQFMPELDESWGYPFAIVLMIVSSALTLLFFKRKKWL